MLDTVYTDATNIIIYTFVGRDLHQKCTLGRDLQSDPNGRLLIISYNEHSYAAAATVVLYCVEQSRDETQQRFPGTLYTSS